MKKLALILAFLVIPCAAFGLEMLNDNSMDAITGQAGVHIAVDDVEMFINIDRMAWIDCDGYNWVSSGGCSAAGGALYIGQFQLDTLRINAILSSVTTDSGTTQTSAGTATQLYSASCGNVPLFYDYGDSTPFAGCYLGSTTSAQVDTQGLDNLVGKAGTGQFIPSAITIDVTDDLPAIGQAYRAATAGSSGFAGVLIGLPTVELSIGNITFTPTYTGDINGVASDAVNNNTTFGTFVIEGVTVSILSGWMEIGPH